MREKKFDKLIDQYLKNRLNVEDKNKVDGWLDHMADNTLYNSLPELEKQKSAEVIYQQLTSRIVQTNEVMISPLMITMRAFYKVAACVVLFSCLAFAFRIQLKDFFNIDEYASIVNSKGHITKNILSDGTIVWLKGNSSLKYPVKFKGSNTRDVILEGEALFEVAKDAAHPFIISCGGLTTRVLGTSFNIKKNDSKIEVNVLTGRVFLSSENTGNVVLHPYQLAVYSELKKVIVKQPHPVVAIAELTEGTEYNMLFNDVRVEDVLKRIEKKFEIIIDAEDPTSRNSRITADLTDQSLKNTMNMISEALNLNYQIEGRTVILKNKTIK